MNARTPEPVEFDSLRPRILALLELHRAAQTDEARAQLVEMFEDAFLATAWHVAQDLLENGWTPTPIRAANAPAKRAALRIVGGTDAA